MVLWADAERFETGIPIPMPFGYGQSIFLGEALALVRKRKTGHMIHCMWQQLTI